jgi:hypothetical protein
MGDEDEENIAAVEKMDISDLEKKIFEDNARSLFRLPVNRRQDRGNRWLGQVTDEHHIQQSFIVPLQCDP